MRIEELYTDKKIAVTGGLGSIGIQLVNALKNYDVEKITVLDNRETCLFYSSLENIKNSSKIKFVYGDVRNIESLRNAIQDVDILFHTAALKHISVCEEHPYEAVMTNIIGTYNVLRVSEEIGVKRVVIASTDKAVEPTSVLGATKHISERLARNFSHRLKVVIARFGNVLGSRGSVLEIWEKSVRDRGKIPLTHPEMTRFFILPEECTRKLLYLGVTDMHGTFIFKSKSAYIKMLAEVFRELRGGEIEIIGIRDGEKIHEKLVAETEKNKLWENKEFFVVSDESPGKEFVRAPIRNFSSNSEEFLMDVDTLRQLVKRILTRTSI